MIFVTLGTERFAFDRLVRAIDRAVQDGTIREKVVIQSGRFDYKPSACETRNLLEYEHFIELASNASLYICHGGVGSIMSGLYLKKKPIVVPRYKELGENIDDHQVEITHQLALGGIITPCFKDDRIEVLVGQASHDDRPIYANSTKDALLSYIKEQVRRG